MHYQISELAAKGDLNTRMGIPMGMHLDSQRLGVLTPGLRPFAT